MLLSPTLLRAHPDRQNPVFGFETQRAHVRSAMATRIPARAVSLRSRGLDSLILGVLGWAFAFASASVQAQSSQPQAGPDPTIAGRVLASNCANCHGVDGRSAGGMPTLAGYQRDAMITTMQAFRSGQRSATIMHQLAKGYTDEQLVLLAEHFSRQKPNQ